MKTVMEVALENRVAELTRELYLARAEYPSTVTAAKPTILLDRLPPPTTLTLAASWQCDYDVQHGQFVRGEAYFKDNPCKFGHTYYMSELQRLTPNGALEYLGEMHKDVIRKLAAHWGRPR